MYDKAGNPRSGNARARFADGVAEDKKMAPHRKAPKDMPPGTQGTDEGEMEGEKNVSHMPIHEVVAKHGPAHHIVVHHDHEGGVHTKTSHHGMDGHHHHSEHGSAQEAHDHAMQAAGIGGETEDHEDYETPETEAAEMARAGGRIPGMG